MYQNIECDSGSLNTCESSIKVDYVYYIYIYIYIYIYMYTHSDHSWKVV